MSEQTSGSDELFLKCGNCNDSEDIYHTLKNLNDNYKNIHPDIAKYYCGYCVTILLNKTSLMRHLKAHEAIHAPPIPRAAPATAPPEQDVIFIEEPCNSEGMDIDIDVNDDTEEQMNSAEETTPNNLHRTAGEVLLQMRSKASLTGAAIQLFQEGCSKLLQSQKDSILDQVAVLLREKGLPEDDLAAVLEQIETPNDVFDNMDTIPKQLDLFAREFGLVIAEEKFLGTRINKRLDPKLNTYLQTQIDGTFMSVSFTATLSILSSKRNRNNIFKDQVSTDAL